MKISSKRSKILIVVIGVLLILSLNFFQKEVKNFFYLVSAPIQNAFWEAGDRISDFFETTFGAGNLKKEKEELQQKNQELLRAVAQLEELKKENEELRKALELELEKEFKLILADISGKDPLRDAVFINKGSKDGISRNFPVITSQKTLVGKIEEVYNNFSKVDLISDKNSSFSAQVIDIYSSPDSSTKIQGIVRGEGGYKIVLDLVPQKIKIEKGNPVITTGFDDIFPEGLLVGSIKTVLGVATPPFQKAEIEPAFNLEELGTVFIISEF